MPTWRISAVFLRFTSIVALAVMALVINAAYAGHYELIEGKGVQVCEAYQRNFESFDNATPMACERQYSPEIKGFASPIWQKLDLEQHFALYKKTMLYVLEKGPLSPKDKQEVVDHLAGRAKHLKVALYVTRVNLDGDGELVNVLAVREMSCGPQQTSERTKLYVFNNTLSDIDHSRQDSWGNLGENATLELYDGKPYIETYAPDDGWQNLLTKSGRFYVNRELSRQEMAKEGTRWRLKPVCEFQYVPSGDAQ